MSFESNLVSSFFQLFLTSIRPRALLSLFPLSMLFSPKAYSCQSGTSLTISSDTFSKDERNKASGEGPKKTFGF